jgi:hypothetical protein
MPLEELNIGEDLTYQEYLIKIWETLQKSLGTRGIECAKCIGAIIPKKLLGKEKINKRKISQISFLICSNLNGEIHPKVVGL